MKCLIIGGSGGIGKKLTSEIRDSYGWNVTETNSKDLDVTQSDKVQSFFDANEFDVVVLLSAKNKNSFCHKLNDSLIQEQVSVNVVGAANVAGASLKMMRKRGFGRLIMASSILSEKTVVGTSIYSASKSFVETLCRVAAVENSNSDITVNSLRLGYFDAGLTHEIPDDIASQIKSDIPKKKWGDVKEIASMIKTLTDSSYITGSVIKIAGGL